MCSELYFLWPQEVKFVDMEFIEPVLCETSARCERRGVCWQWREGEEGILGMASNDPEVLWE